MVKRTYWKALWRSIKVNKLRFLSMTSLMALGAFALVGLKMTPASMENTAQSYIAQTDMMDLAVIADYGFSQADREELESLDNLELEFSHLLDVTVKGKSEALRLFSLPEKISKPQLVEGRLPQSTSELVLDQELKGRYKIGDKLTLQSYRLPNLPLVKTELTVTGFAKSADMWFKDNYGDSREGDGGLAGFGLLLPEAFTSPSYSLLKIRLQSLKDRSYYVKDYQTEIDSYKDRLEGLLEDNPALRYQEVKQEAGEKLSKAKEEVLSAESQLNEAKESIQSQENHLKSGEKGLEAAKKSLNENKTGIEQSQNHLQGQAAILDHVKKSLDSTKKQLDSTKFLLDDTKAVLDGQHAQLTLVQNQLALEKASLDQLAGQISSAQALLAQDIRDYEAGNSAYIYSDFELRASQIAEDSQRYQQAYEAYQLSLSTYQSQAADYQARFFQYQEGLASYQESYDHYQASLDNYETSLSHLQSGENQIVSGQNKLSQSEEELTEKAAELDDGKAKLEKAKEELASKERETLSQLNQAKKDIAQSEDSLAGLKLPSYKVFDRTNFPGAYGYQIYKTSTDNIRTVSGIFPVVLYLVAALVTLTSMTRFVDEERQKAGLFKALGYSKQDILANFLIYASLTSLLGTLLGSIAGYFILSPMVGNLLTGQSILEKVSLTFQPHYFLVALLLAFISTILPTWLVAHKEVAAETSVLLQAKAPVQGAKILLENWSALWRRLSFTQKVTARNIFRYKQRLFMTVLGVAGSVALLFAGLGIRSSISSVSDRQYQDLIRYDLLVLEENQPSQEEHTKLIESLDKTNQTWQSLNFQKVQTQVGDRLEEIPIFISQEPLDDFISLQERKSGKSLTLSDKGVIISEKLAGLVKVKSGQDIKVTLEGKDYLLKVDAITEHYAGHVIYSSANYYEQLKTGVKPTQAYFVKSNQTSSNLISERAEDFLSQPAVTAIIQNKNLTTQLTSLADSLQSVMVILVLVATLLAIVILYNLTNINLVERVRELSTIKVLGFHPREVTLYIYRETIILSLLGIVLGLIAGNQLHSFIINRIGSNNIMFMPTVSWEVYLIPLVTILLILLGLGLWVNSHLKKLDMLEALKSVD